MPLPCPPARASSGPPTPFTNARSQAGDKRVSGVALLSVGLALAMAPPRARADIPREPSTPESPASSTSGAGSAAVTPAPSVRSAAPPPSGEVAPPSLSERISAGITRVGPTSATITREARDLALANVMVFARAARLVPANEGDGVVGFRVFGIRRGSLFALLGLRNGDLLRSVNGRPLTTVQEALAAYSGLRGAPAWVLRVQRRGAEATLNVRVVDGGAEAPSAP